MTGENKKTTKKQWRYQTSGTFCYTCFTTWYLPMSSHTDSHLVSFLLSPGPKPQRHVACDGFLLAAQWRLEKRLGNDLVELQHVTIGDAPAMGAMDPWWFKGDQKWWKNMVNHGSRDPWWLRWAIHGGLVMAHGEAMARPMVKNHGEPMANQWVGAKRLVKLILVLSASYCCNGLLLLKSRYTTLRRAWQQHTAGFANW